jgi:hypothetical protein
MSDLNVKIPHNLDRESATAKAKNIISGLKGQYSGYVKNVDEKWNGNTGTFSFDVMGSSVEGQIIVEDKEIVVTGGLPFMAMPFKGKIEDTIKSKGAEFLR